MVDELIDIFDSKDIYTNKQEMKSFAHKNGLWHRAAHIWIYNSNGKIMLQLRAKIKDYFPNVWDISAAGHVSAGEEPINSAIREIEEEIGLKVKEEDLLFFKIKKVETQYKEIDNKEFYYVYFLKYEDDISKLKLQDEEVEKIDWFSIDFLREDIKNNPKKYVSHENYWYEIFDEIERRKFN